MRRGPPALALFNEVKQAVLVCVRRTKHEVFVWNAEVLIVVFKG